MSLTRRHVLGGLMIAPLSSVAEASVPVIAAAASLRYALDEMAQVWRQKTGRSVRISYAASGQLVQQIEAGAPFQMFLSADEPHVNRLVKARHTVGAGAVYAVGRLALVVPDKSSVRLDAKLQGLGVALRAGNIRRFAIANPLTAPYGMQAKRVLENAGLWSAVQPYLVQGENVGQAFQFMATGGADAGIVSLSLALSEGFKGRFTILSGSFHQPLVQRMVLLKSADKAVRDFYDFILSREGQMVLGRHGYLGPA